MSYRENLNIIIMRDKGPRRSLHFQRNRFYICMLFFACLPFICILLGVQCWKLWKDNQELEFSIEKFEADCQRAQAQAERLQNLEFLLREENVPQVRVLLTQLGAEAIQTQSEQQIRQGKSAAPGEVEHNSLDSPYFDAGRVKVSNVQARLQRGNVLRIGADLRNPENGQLLAGTIHAALLTGNGDSRMLKFDAAGSGSFRISKFKRSVMTSRLAPGTPLENAQVLLEIRDEKDVPIYRNVFSVER